MLFNYAVTGLTAFWFTLIVFFGLMGLAGLPLFPEPPLSPGQQVQNQDCGGRQ